ncbi:uncharacterized protein LOC110456165 [Mizuhopecten yessoensis]|uniref:uncharacterized protein LOC110456165 n=1 Tax=Mizuhopecten yessoensis TaxID=6573 RepID=UPI000B45B51B|nr:uncharacterized protein LOC110456165 [Mizuhopecten yessoensis]
MLKIAVAVLLLVSIVKSDGDGDGDGHGHGRDLFDKYDGNNDDRLSDTEFRKLFMNFDSWPEDQQISEHEFIAGWSDPHSEFSEASSAALFFFRTDLDHNGLVSIQDVDKLFNMFDENGNHDVSKAEFCDAFTAMFYALNHC